MIYDDGGGVCTCLFGEEGREGPNDLYISKGSPICLYSGTFRVRLKAFAITTLNIFCTLIDDWVEQNIRGDFIT